MPLITPDVSRTFVEAVTLAPAPEAGRPRQARALDEIAPVALASTEPQALVAGSGLIAAAANVPAATREDLINCTLFAQLAATGEVSDPNDIPQWYTLYFRTLTALGWAQSDTQFEQYDVSSQNAEAHQAIMSVLGVLLGPQAAALTIVKAAIDALQSMDENSPWITLFDQQSRTERAALFQVVTAQLGADGLLQTALAGFDLETASSLTQILFFKFKSSAATLRYAAGRATIYEQALAAIRGPVAERLAAYRATYIGQVKLPPPPGTARSLDGTPRAAGHETAAPPGSNSARIRRYLLSG
jgi:hypothetical protein